ncbi:zinc finger protein 862-like [Liolophura sinensis]|uniref:zinc finger protein 862-like n=1 Tax=Liolophura sinensis TaxID=3198878 RepID=UPI003158326A
MSKGKITDFFRSKEITNPSSSSSHVDVSSESDGDEEIVGDPRDRSPIKRATGTASPSPQTSTSRPTASASGPSWSVSGERRETNAAPEQSGRVRKFPNSWLDQFPWLEYDEVENVMVCKDCREFGVEGSWSTGNNNFRLKTVKEHVASDAHKTAAAGSQPGQVSLNTQWRKEREERRKAIVTALKTAYWLATEEMPNRKYGSLINFLQELNLKEAKFLNRGKNAKYTSPDVYNQLTECLSKVIWRQLKSGIRQSPTIGIGIDESTDRAQEKHVAVIVRHITKEGRVTTDFLSLERIEDGTAVASFEALNIVAKKLDVPWKKVMGLGADGASVMSGERNGLRSLVEKENPHCTYVHCVCHRLNLAVSQACKTFPEMETVNKILSAVYSYINQSPKKHQEFKEIAILLEADSVKFKRVFEIRWLSMGESVLALIKNYEPLTFFLSQEADRGDPVAVGLLQQLTSFLYLGLLFLTADILAAIHHLSKLFQFRDVSFSAIQGSLKDCRDTLQAMQTQDGPHLGAMMAQLQAGDPEVFRGQRIRMLPTGRGQHQPLTERFQEVRRDFIQEILDNLESRFPQVTLLNAMQVFDPMAYPQNPEDLFHWGNSHLNTLLEFYGESKENADGVRFDRIVDPDVARGEFLPFKRVLHRNRSDEGAATPRFLRPIELFEKIFDARDRLGNRQIFPELFKLMSASVTVMVGNAEAERVFSAQNRIKSKLRAGLTVEHLDHLIRINYSKRPACQFPFEEAADLFFEQNRRI